MNTHENAEGEMNKKDISDLIGDIKKSYHKSNLSNVTNEYLSSDIPQKRIGYILKTSPNLSEKDFAMNFDPVEAHLLKKLVSNDTMGKRIVLRAEDYFKGIIFVDYFANVITKNNTFTDELYEIAKEFERINPLLDPDMDIITKYAGISYVSLKGKEYLMSRSSIESAEKRFRKDNAPFDDSYLKVKTLDPLYASLGEKVYSLIRSPEILSHLDGFKGINDLRAMIFLDCLMPYITEQSSKDDVKKFLDNKEYYAASVKAITIFSREASLKTMEEYMHSVVENSRSIDPDSI